MQQYQKLLEVLDKLLGEDGCAWDKAQTHESLRPNLIEESNEVIEAIDSGDMDALKDELGDVLLQVVFHSKLAEKSGHFTFDDVCAAITNKLIRRHTHIFGDDKASTPEEVAKLWAKNKLKEKK